MLEKVYMDASTKLLSFEKPITNIVNLSSCPTDHIISSIILKVKLKIKDIHTTPIIQTRSHIVLENGSLQSLRTSSPAWFIADEDDELYNMKIHNMTKVMNVRPIGIIVLRALGLNRDQTRSVGTHLYLASHHTTKNALTEQGARNMITNDPLGISFVTLINTSDKLSGSIAGLCFYVECLQVPYNIIYRSSKSPPSWLLMPYRHIKNLTVLDKDTAVDFIPDDDKRWQYKTGYTDRLFTNTGVKYITAEPIGPSKLKRGIIRVLKELLNYSIALVKRAVNSVMAFLFKPHKSADVKDKTNDNRRTNKNKRKNKVTFDMTEVTTKKSNARLKKTPGRRSKTKVGLNWTVLPSVAYLTSLAAYSYCKSIPKNASKDIDEANDMLARWQISKIASKVTASSDKTKITHPISRAFNTYIVGAQNFNVLEAGLSADIQAAKTYDTKAAKSLVMNTLLLIIICLFSGYIIRTGAILLTAFVGYVNYEYEIAILMCGIISPVHLMSKIIMSFLLVFETVLKVPETIKRRLMPVLIPVTIMAQISARLI